jgi:hypothetical protein
MKIATLRSIGHNIGHSVASGIGFMIHPAVYDMDIFGEAAKSPEGFIEVDFLTGSTSGGTPSSKLARALALYRDALPGLCERHGVQVSDFRELRVKYVPYGVSGSFTVIVEDRRGKRSTKDYVGREGSRRMVSDHLGRIRSI